MRVLFPADEQLASPASRSQDQVVKDERQKKQTSVQIAAADLVGMNGKEKMILMIKAGNEDPFAVFIAQDRKKRERRAKIGRKIKIVRQDLALFKSGKQFRVRGVRGAAFEMDAVPVLEIECHADLTFPPRECG